MFFLQGNKMTYIPNEIGNLSNLKSLTISNDITVMSKQMKKQNVIVKNKLSVKILSMPYRMLTDLTHL